MTELEAWNWLKHQYGYNLTKSGDSYNLNVIGLSQTSGVSVLECVIKMRKRNGE